MRTVLRTVVFLALIIPVAACETTGSNPNARPGDHDTRSFVQQELKRAGIL